MWEFIQSSLTTILFMLVALACPLMHAFGHCGSKHRHAPPPERRDG